MKWILTFSNKPHHFAEATQCKHHSEFEERLTTTKTKVPDPFNLAAGRLSPGGGGKWVSENTCTHLEPTALIQWDGGTNPSAHIGLLASFQWAGGTNPFVRRNDRIYSITSAPARIFPCNCSRRVFPSTGWKKLTLLRSIVVMGTLSGGKVNAIPVLFSNEWTNVRCSHQHSGHSQSMNNCLRA